MSIHAIESPANQGCASVAPQSLEPVLDIGRRDAFIWLIRKKNREKPHGFGTRTPQREVNR